MIILYILLAIVVLLFMVLIHELGHYVVGRALKFKIDEFSVGFGKAIISRTNKRGEKISLRLFPLGGYCAFAGEDGLDKDGNPMEGGFTSQKPWKRILVFFAGVTFNFLTAIIFSFILLVSVGYDIPQYKDTQTKTYDNVISVEMAEDYNPELNSLLPGDVIFRVNGTKVDFAYSANYQDLVNKEVSRLTSWLAEKDEDGELVNDFAQHAPVQLRVRRDGEMIDLDLYFVRVGYTQESGDGAKKTYYSYALGGYFDGYENGDIAIDDGQIVLTYPLYSPYRHSFIEALARCVPFAFGLAWIVLKSLAMLFVSLFTWSFDASQIGGPIATIATIASVTQTNMLNLLVLIPLISANLAVFNILPIPALDGAHVVFTLIEWIRGKPIKREVENMIHTIGLMVLFGLVILVDILHFVL